MTDEQKAFFRLIIGPALESERRLEVPAAVTIAQAILESAWGKSRLFREANNPFGIKNLDLPDDYGEYTAPTIEYIAGKPQTIVAHFERFRTLDDACFHHALLFWRAQRYWPAMKVRGDPFAFAASIGRCGYSTDPNYGEKLSKLIELYQLQDRRVLVGLLGDPLPAPVEGADV